MARPRAPRRAQMSRRLLHTVGAMAMAALALAVGCELAVASARAPSNARVAAPARRIVAHAVVSAHTDAAPALAPMRLAADAERLIVLDAAHRRLAIWTPHDSVQHAGAVLSRAPFQLARRGDRIGVLDARDARLTVLDSRGRIRARFGLAHLPPAFAACAFADGSWLVLTAGDGDALIRLDSVGAVLWRRPVPWPVVTTWPPLARQGVLAPTRDGCALALAFGPGWAEVQPDGRMPTVMPLREAGPSPRQSWRRRTERTAQTPLVADVVVRGDTIELLAVGTTLDAWRVIDRFHVRTGAYLGSIRLPGPVRAISATPDGWGAIVPTPRGPRLARLRPVRIPSVGNGLRSR